MSKQYEKEWEFSFDKIGEQVRSWVGGMRHNDEASIETEQAEFSVPMGEARHLTLEIDFSVAEVTITPLEADADLLFHATIDYINAPTFAEQGDTDKTIFLSQNDNNNKVSFNTPRLSWTIRLNPRVATTLQIKGGVGRSNLDFSAFNIDYLSYSGGVGEARLKLPLTDFTGRLRAGVGALSIVMAQPVNATLNIRDDIGKTDLHLPEDVGVNLTASVGVGKIDVPAHFVELDSNRTFVTQNGVWAANADTAEKTTTINYNGGVGRFHIGVTQPETV
jgi:hypothetical protein